MIAKIDCIVCMQNQALSAARICKCNEKKQEVILKKVMKSLLKENWKKTPPELAEVIQEIICQETKIKDPYFKLKKKYNKLALTLYPKMKKIVEKSKDKISTAAKISIAGNIIDFGSANEEDISLEKTIERVLKLELPKKDLEVFKKLVFNSKKMLFFVDNAGEIVFDKLLIETIINERKIKNKEKFEEISVVVKNKPILNDAMLEDVIEIGFEKISNITFLKTSEGKRSWPDKNSKKVKEWIKKHDLVISKGQGNYESLSSVKGINFLLLAKCKFIAKNIGAKKGDLILKYFK